MSDLRSALEGLRVYCGSRVDDPNSSEEEQVAYDDVAIRAAEMLAAEVDPETGFARPLLDREAVLEQIWRSLAGSGLTGIFRDELAEAQADAVMELARPMPTREQIDQALAGKPIVRSADKPSDWRGGLSPNEIGDITTIVLALLNGTES